MLNKSNLLFQFVVNIICNKTNVILKITFNSMQSFSLIKRKKTLSLPFLVTTGTRLLFCPVTKNCFHFSYVNHVYKPVISSAYPTSTAFFPACSVLCSFLSTPAPASLLYPAIFCGIISSVHFLFAWVNHQWKLTFAWVVCK